MKVAIIGAGPAGLASARRAQQYNLECTVFEITGTLGGTWVYINNPLANEFNNPITSSCYASLQLITPAPTMELEGLEFKPKSGLTYPGHEEVLEYYQNYSKKYNLQQYMKFHHQVLGVSRKINFWKITVKDLKQNIITDHLFDAVVLCSGRYSLPKLPIIDGMEKFYGDQIHSHYFRRNDQYKDKRVLIVGGGHSAMDISSECSKVAKKVYVSYRSVAPTNLAKDIEIKGAISSIHEHKIQFKDHTYIHVDSIIYCTGYQFDASLLDPSCGIEILEGHILKPLHKMFININQPTMAILGLNKRTPNVKLYDIQTQVFMMHLSGCIHLPSTEDMLKSFYDEFSKREHRGAQYYEIREDLKEYYDDLAQMANLKPMPLVLFRLFVHSVNHRRNSWAAFRNQILRPIDDENFEIQEINDTQNENKASNEFAETRDKFSTAN